MAWEYPKHACGHAGERVQMYGPTDGRERRLRAMERQDCPECRAMRAKEQAAAAGLPELSGTPKQIAWASEIRERALRLLPAEQAEKVKPETSARWWIDHQGGR